MLGYKNPRCIKIISVLLIAAFLGTNFAIASDSHALSPTSELKPIARIVKQNGAYSVVSDAGQLSKDARFKEVAEALSLNTAAIRTIGRALYLRLSESGVKELLRRRLSIYPLVATGRVEIQKKTDDSIFFTCKDARQGIISYRSFLPNNEKLPPRAQLISLPDGKIFGLQVLSIEKMPVNTAEDTFMLENFFTFEEYMAQALYNPVWGFYSGGKIRLGHDFGTMPIMLSPVFGQMAAERFFQMWKGMVKAGTIANDEKFYVIEFGAGTGILARDILSHVSEKSQLDREWKIFYNQFQYVIGEIAPPLIQKQSDNNRRFIENGKLEIRQSDARKMDNLFGAGKKIKGVVFSNELMDAFPAHRITIDSNGRAHVIVCVPTLEDKLFSEEEFFNGDQVLPGSETMRSVASFIEKGLKNTGLSMEELRKKSSKAGYYGLNSQFVRDLVQDPFIVIGREDAMRLQDILSRPGMERYRKVLNAYLTVKEYEVPIESFPELKKCFEVNSNEIKNALAGDNGRMGISLGWFEFVRSASSLLDKGYVFTIDDGYMTSELMHPGKVNGDNIRVFHRQFGNVGNPYRHWGELDICAMPDYGMMEKEGLEHGLRPVFNGALVSLQEDISLKIDSEDSHKQIVSYLERFEIAIHIEPLVLKARKDLSETEKSEFRAAIEKYLEKGECPLAGSISKKAEEVFTELITGAKKAAEDTYSDWRKMFATEHRILIQQKEGTDPAYYFGTAVSVGHKKQLGTSRFDEEIFREDTSRNKRLTTVPGREGNSQISGSRPIGKEGEEIPFFEEALDSTIGIDMDGSERRASLMINQELMSELSETDLSRIKEKIGKDHAAEENVRSARLDLEHPITHIKGERLQIPIESLWIKGIVFDSRSELSFHEGDDARGSVPYLFLADKNGLIHRRDSEGVPHGAAYLRDVINEYLISMDITHDVRLKGKAVPKYPVGWGEFFIETPFRDKDGDIRRLGFVILGNSAELMKRSNNTTWGEDTAAALKTLHDNGYFRHYTHPGNISILPDGSTQIHDLDIMVDQRTGMTPEEMLANQFLDFDYVFGKLVEMRALFTSADEEITIEGVGIFEKYFPDEDASLGKITFKEVERLLREAQSAPVNEIKHPLIDALKRNMERAGLADLGIELHSDAKGAKDNDLRIEVEREFGMYLTADKMSPEIKTDGRIEYVRFNVNDEEGHRGPADDISRFRLSEGDFLDIFDTEESSALIGRDMKANERLATEKITTCVGVMFEIVSKGRRIPGISHLLSGSEDQEDLFNESEAFLKILTEENPDELKIVIYSDEIGDGEFSRNKRMAYQKLIQELRTCFPFAIIKEEVWHGLYEDTALMVSRGGWAIYRGYKNISGPGQILCGSWAEVENRINNHAESLLEEELAIALDKPAVKDPWEMYMEGETISADLSRVVVREPKEMASLIDTESRRGGIFLDELKILAQKAKEEGRKILIALEIDGLVSTGQRSMMQPLLSELHRLEDDLRKIGLDNVIIVRGSGSEFAVKITKAMSASSIKLQDVIVLGREDTLNSSSFDNLKSTDSINGALLVGIDPRNLSGYNYMRLLEMLMIALSIADGKQIDPKQHPEIIIEFIGKRLIRLIPLAEPMKYEELKTIYKGQFKSLQAA
ncbi:MAG: SAM-dependent methyltransferase [Candidatus Omnitrophota bacterium]|nr:SAM-dependent methyltransferase [Candidatus Omnitrophota bacterium]